MTLENKIELKTDADVSAYCAQNAIELFMGDDNSDFDFRAEIKGKTKNERFTIETVTKKGLYQLVSPYFGNQFVPCDTIITWLTSYCNGGVMGASPDIKNGYAYREGYRLVSGEMSGPKNWKHFGIGDNNPLPYDIKMQFKPAIDLLEYLTGRTLVKERL